MVDTDPGIALKRVPPVVPEGVDALIRVELHDRVRPPLPEELSKLLARFRRVERVLEPTFGLVDIALRRDHVVIAQDDGRKIALDEVLRMTA